MVTIEQLQYQIHQQLAYITNKRVQEEEIPSDLLSIWARKKKLFQERDAEIVKATANVSFIRQLNTAKHQEVDYQIHFQYLVRQRHLFYVEEEQMERRLQIENGYIIHDRSIENVVEDIRSEAIEREVIKGKGEYTPYTYNRLEAVKYAERWWDDRNPAFRNFPDNCTNFISQCLYAGDTPMRGYPNIRKGWWQQNNQWSWSWAVAHSFYWYLSGETVGLRAKQVEKPEDLLLGDIIIYDFENDGRWNHTTIVVAKDANGMPLVNAHSANSRRRYWAYEDSSKYTPQMKYKFFHILDND
ncbi:amidase domain-containing protein [Bacillus manliponensis]|uniref:amidase domain-containing protein n=1 Tax=Bacillus manliponensis TaxID=574376 RepID=UPI0035119D1C